MTAVSCYLVLYHYSIDSLNLFDGSCRSMGARMEDTETRADMKCAISQYPHTDADFRAWGPGKQLV